MPTELRHFLLGLEGEWTYPLPPNARLLPPVWEMGDHIRPYLPVLADWNSHLRAERTVYCLLAFHTEPQDLAYPLELLSLVGATTAPSYRLGENGTLYVFAVNHTYIERPRREGEA